MFYYTLHLSDMSSSYFPFSSFPRISWLIRTNGFVNLKLQATFIVKNSHKNLSRPSPATIYTSTDVNRTKRVSGYLFAAEWSPLLSQATCCFGLEKSVLTVSLWSLTSPWCPREEPWLRAILTFQVFSQCRGEPLCQSVTAVSDDLASRVATGEDRRGTEGRGY